MSEGKDKVYFLQDKAEILEYAFIRENYRPENSEIQISSRLGFTFARKSSVLKCQYEVVFKQKDIAFIKCVISMDYRLREDTVEQYINDNVVCLPPHLLKHFASTTIGTMRGVLLAKNQEHGFDILLPPVNLNEVIKDPLMVE